MAKVNTYNDSYQIPQLSAEKKYSGEKEPQVLISEGDVLDIGEKKELQAITYTKTGAFKYEGSGEVHDQIEANKMGGGGEKAKNIPPPLGVISF